MIFLINQSGKMSLILLKDCWYHEYVLIQLLMVRILSVIFLFLVVAVLLAQVFSTQTFVAAKSITKATKKQPRPVTIKTEATTNSWSIKSVSSMKETKDRICGQRSDAFIKKWISKAKELGVSYVAIETPYDNPDCGDALSYTNRWVSAARAQGLKIWHRHMPLSFEGIYSRPKDNTTDYLNLISEYIKQNPTLFAKDDIFTPIPEPQNGGIKNITYCSQSVCQFDSAADFNLWLRNAMSTANEAFKTIGLGDQIKIGYFGFDGFVAWGDNNPDWSGILEDETVSLMGNITIDHYPETVNDTMENDLNELQAKYPNVPIIIGEWGTVTGKDVISSVKATMSAASRSGVVGFNYWHLGMGGNEALINDDFSNKPQFREVQSFFRQH